MAMTIAVLSCFAAVAALTLAIIGWFETSPLQARLERLRGHAAEAPTPGSLIVDTPESSVGKLLARLGESTREAGSPGLEKLKTRLARAGYRGPAHLSVYFGSRIAFAVLLPLLVLTWPPAQTLGTSEHLVLIAVAAAFGLVVPSFLIDRRIARRQRAIEEGLPDALDLMVVCIEAGLGLSAAIQRVATEYRRSNPPLADEFGLVFLEAQAGKTTVEALRGLAARTGLAEVGSLVAMLIQTERFGTSIADALRVQADGMRRRRILRAEESAAKAPLKMLFPAGLFIFPATLILIAGPGVMRLVETLTSG